MGGSRRERSRSRRTFARLLLVLLGSGLRSTSVTPHLPSAGSRRFAHGPHRLGCRVGSVEIALRFHACRATSPEACGRRGATILPVGRKGRRQCPPSRTCVPRRSLLAHRDLPRWRPSRQRQLLLAPRPDRCRPFLPRCRDDRRKTPRTPRSTHHARLLHQRRESLHRLEPLCELRQPLSALFVTPCHRAPSRLAHRGDRTPNRPHGLLPTLRNRYRPQRHDTALGSGPRLGHNRLVIQRPSGGHSQPVSARLPRLGLLSVQRLEDERRIWMETRPNGSDSLKRLA
jgi:hypothetical protein